MKPVVDAFKSAQLFIPTKIHDIKPNASTVDTLRSFKFLDNDQTVNNLKSELPTYLALTEDIIDVDSLLWWEKNSKKLPFWANACKFTEQQQSALEDYVEAALMIQYNHK